MVGAQAPAEGRTGRAPSARLGRLRLAARGKAAGLPMTILGVDYGGVPLESTGDCPALVSHPILNQGGPACCPTRPFVRRPLLRENLIMIILVQLSSANTYAGREEFLEIRGGVQNGVQEKAGNYLPARRKPGREEKKKSAGQPRFTQLLRR